MNRVQNQKLKRLLNVSNYLNDKPTIAATLMNVAVWQPRLDNITTDIITHAAAQATTFTGSTQAKASLKAQIVDLGFFTTTCAKAYARSTNNTVLYERVDISMAGLKKLNDTDLINAANIIHTAAHDNIAAISAVTTLVPTQLTALKQLIADFTKYLPQAQSSRNTIKIHTQAIVNLLAEATLLLDEIGDYVELTQFANPLFYKGYLSANKIGNAITRNRALQINVTDNATQNPVFKADIIITNSAGKTIATKKTTAKGNAYLQDLKEQDYTISIVQTGYATYTNTISVTDGTTLLVAAALETMV
jgi:hypothetical protein